MNTPTGIPVIPLPVPRNSSRQQQRRRQQQLPQPPSVVVPLSQVQLENGMTTTGGTQEEWREREHRQRTIRLFMMFLMMLLLMDEKNNAATTTTSNQQNIMDPNNRNYNPQQQNRLRGRRQQDNTVSLMADDDSFLSHLLEDTNFFPGENHNSTHRHSSNNRNMRLLLQHRIEQDTLLRTMTQQHERYQSLIRNKNHNIDYNTKLHTWCQQQQIMRTQNALDTTRPHRVGTVTSVVDVLQENVNENLPPSMMDDADDDDNDSTMQETLLFNDNGNLISKKVQQSEKSSKGTEVEVEGIEIEAVEEVLDDPTIVYHYPWNTTGFYRGSWQRIITSEDSMVLRRPLEEEEEESHDTNHDNHHHYNRKQQREDQIQLLSTIILHDQQIGSNRYNSIGTAIINTNTSSTTTTTISPSETNTTNTHTKYYINAIQIEEEMIQRLRYRKQLAAIVPLPFGTRLRQYDSTYCNNSTSYDTDRALEMNAKVSTKLLNDPPHPSQQQRRIAGMNEYSSRDIFSFLSPKHQSATIQENHSNERRLQQVQPHVPLTRDDGRAAIQLFGKRISGMKELSYVSGFVKLHDSSPGGGYSTRKDILLRVQGVLVHAIGRISLVANMDTDSMAFVIDPSYNPKDDTHRRLQEAVRSLVTSSSLSATKPKHGSHAKEEDAALINIRNDALKLHGNEKHDPRELESREEGMWKINTVIRAAPDNASLQESNQYETVSNGDDTISNNKNEVGIVQLMGELGSTNNDKNTNTWSNVVFPYPFVHEDAFGSISKTRTLLTTKTLPVGEQALEANAAGCTFEITMDVSEVEYTIGSWKKTLLRRYKELKLMGLSHQGNNIMNNENSNSEHQLGGTNNAHRHVRPYTSSRSSSSSPYDNPNEALVTKMVGEIHSYNCNFHAQINTTALRTNWDATTSKAINYSFYMMIVCLTQIFLLLRQLLHSQSQSTTIRVSLLCIGWQTVIDALLCLTHIYLSLAVQPLFTAFASVAFFKLLIFCVIGMKYMAIIVQARYNSNGGTLSADALRKQVAMLHVRFYVALVVVFMIVFYSPGRYRIYNILSLYSFWIPQIILNIITQSKTPLHKNYIYGMSMTRLIAPLYIFGLRNNFLKEVYPESTTDPLMCQLLIVWVGCQTAILIAQGKYGARFMIPKIFLPPKFDYSRPIPASMLPPGALLELPTPELMDDRASDTLLSKVSTKREDGEVRVKGNLPSISDESNLRLVPTRHQTADTTRNRHRRGGRGTSSNTNQNRSRRNTSTTTKDDEPLPKAIPTPAPVLECSICYDDIDIRDRLNYMLAPCNHLYHAECLKQWMEVKMECPICRTQLPAI
jgi:Ring finger domain